MAHHFNISICYSRLMSLITYVVINRIHMNYYNKIMTLIAYNIMIWMLNCTVLNCTVSTLYN